MLGRDCNQWFITEVPPFCAPMIQKEGGLLASKMTGKPWTLWLETFTARLMFSRAKSLAFIELLEAVDLELRVWSYWWSGEPENRPTLSKIINKNRSSSARYNTGTFETWTLSMVTSTLSCNSRSITWQQCKPSSWKALFSLPLRHAAILQIVPRWKWLGVE